MSDALTLSEARKLAKYYSRICVGHSEIAISPENKKQDWECLSYCRGIILQKSKKKNVEEKTT